MDNLLLASNKYPHYLPKDDIQYEIFLTNTTAIANI